LVASRLVAYNFLPFDKALLPASKTKAVMMIQQSR